MVMLVSPTYIRPETCKAWMHEIPAALMARERDELTVLWLPARETDLSGTPFEKIQAGHAPNEPLESLDEKERRAVYETLRLQIHKLLDLS